MKHDNTHASVSDDEKEAAIDDMNNGSCPAILHLIQQLYKGKVVLNSREAAELEVETREQASTELWHSERKLWITASVMKEVRHRKASTTCTAFVQKKINSKILHTPAVCHGREHENDAVSAYVEYQRNCHGVRVKVRKCGQVVYKSLS